MNVYEMFETDKETEENGLDLDYGDFKIKIARSGGSNQKYNKVLEQLTKPHRRAIQTETIDVNLLNDILKEAHAKAVVLGWENVTDRDGNLIEFSSENCYKLFKDLPDLFEDVKDQAAKTGLFRKEVVEVAVGN